MSFRIPFARGAAAVELKTRAFSLLLLEGGIATAAATMAKAEKNQGTKLGQSEDLPLVKVNFLF